MLAGVIDPELHVSIVELGMVDDVQVEPDGHVTVKVALTTAGCPLRHQIKTEVQSKVLGLPGVADVRSSTAMTRQEGRAMTRPLERP
jgi:ATP-binding protein involved in chromosome partitioning